MTEPVSEQFGGGWEIVDICRAPAGALQISVVGLTRAEPTSKWWQTLRPVCSEVRLLDTRLTFRGQDSLYNFPCWVWVAVPPVARPTEPHVWFWDAKKKYDEYFGGTS